MNFIRLVPSIFYIDIRDALITFVDCLEFKIEYDEIHAKNPFCVVSKGNLHINISQDKALAEEHSPELRLVTDNIEKVYEKVSASHPHLLHPNLSKVTLRPWGAKEFAIMDKQLGVIVQQWV